MITRRVLGAVAAALLAASLLSQPAAAGSDDNHQTHHGWIDGAEYRVEVPERWNGTLVLFSHGYLPEIPGWEWELGLTNRSVPYGVPTEQWLLDRGYALAASNYAGVTGYRVERGMKDQLALLDWVEREIGTPRRTISAGQSLGSAMAVQLAEENPRRFDGVLTLCAEYDPLGTWNSALDIAYTVTTLMAPDIKLTGYADEAEAQAALTALGAAVDQAATTAHGRARLALAAALNNITGWYSARDPRPATDAEVSEGQLRWIKNAYLYLTTVGRYDLERHAGGNPSSNTGIDYTRLLRASTQTERVERLYDAAHAEGADLRADLRALATGQRTEADGDARRYMYRNGVQSGDLPVPMLAVHSTGDGGAVADQQRWFAEQAREHGDARKLRTVYVDRGGHCTISGAEEAELVRTLDRRIRTGHWPSLTPRALNTASEALPDDLQRVFDSSSGSDAADTPRFTRHTPPRYLRGSH